jgi:hypothetical protein
MAYEVREMSGSIFKNTRKNNDKSADMTGSGRINGMDVWVNGWVKTDKNGEKWISLSFKEKEPQVSHGDREPAAPKPSSDNDFPF